MPRSLTTSQIDRLGDRLRASEFPSPQDLELLEQLRRDHRPAMAEVHRRLAVAVGVVPTSARLKTTATIIDKLKRQRMRLSRMQDIAGVRIVRPMDRDEQDLLVTRIASLFPDSRVSDRRTRPSFGYRAVHIIASAEECLVEIQTRTEFQDLWAQLVEVLEPVLGRGMRYGEPPSRPRAHLLGKRTLPTRGGLYRFLQQVSSEINLIEEVAQEAARVGDVGMQGEVARTQAGVSSKMKAVVEEWRGWLQSAQTA
jgi:hypothetical protein